jgi:hypothetical protein
MRHVTLGICVLFVNTLTARAELRASADWGADPVWHDGLVEKAVYSATRVVYGKPRTYEAIFFTNKELHDTTTLTKADKGPDTLEVWKFNQIEVIPTPNYDYKYVTTSHLTTTGMVLTRLDCSSQEFCGTSFKQYQANLTDPRSDSRSWKYWSFSYMPGAGRTSAEVRDGGKTMVPFNSLPLFLRGFDFEKKGVLKLLLLPDQKSNRATPHQPLDAEVRYATQDEGSHRLELIVAGKILARFWMAKDRLHVMTKYVSGDGEQSYELKGIERVNYWTIRGE